ncbi:lipoprotein-releasing system permease protein [Parabacteroides sp. PF5-5]|uniref:ABC transporter permease n=2 Tax=unclassified Parabacteroides TaxID=2649774 RepID=UPI0024756B0D|nr:MULTISPECIES: FtsX-like permease family protein [unclassified Parabacteroides]MDH6361420.1 lipoprotein-releasing system permease protein [Parabacteroides sp. PH5-16]MDH6393984.1 lipoprotein-releasing system permease protein [Parabacteroides sp. PFB2-22]MDH6305553.1 lipoprotein-releasing system permease protein [Parabacteroides sp. PH5-39]MDH6316407.1 lipoprotein-releasing system permease protein [Parabacteroides sp. PF5-13]MDH6319892.1 lipoprotein-releasing system permease protein [Parabact
MENKKLNMQNLELFIAKRIHFSKEGERQVTPPAVRIAMMGIALGLAVMILSVSIVIGFKKEVRNKVIGFGSHIQISNFDSNTSYETIPIAISDTLLNDLQAYPGIRHVEKYATKPGILKTDTDFQGIILKGIDEDFDWTFFRENLKEGDVFSIDPKKTTTDVIISKYLANLLNLKTGDSFHTYFVQEDVRARKFTITGIYETGFLDYDKLFVITDIKQIRRLNGWDSDLVSGLELLVDNYDHLDQTAEDLFFDLVERKDRQGNSFFVQSIKDLNPMIFNWLDVLDINVVVILILMMAVAGFTMISGLLIIILERTNMIGILKAMGQDNTSIRKVFLYVSFFLIGKGMIWGNVIGITICLIQSHFHIIKLDPATYYLNAVPIDLSIPTLILINIGTLVASMFMMLAPSHLITKIAPARSIRFE